MREPSAALNSQHLPRVIPDGRTNSEHEARNSCADLVALGFVGDATPTTQQPVQDPSGALVDTEGVAAAFGVSSLEARAMMRALETLENPTDSDPGPLVVPRSLVESLEAMVASLRAHSENGAAEAIESRLTHTRKHLQFSKSQK